MKHYYFIETESGEEFLVGARDSYKAREIAFDIGQSIMEYYGFDTFEIDFQYVMDDFEAEASGLDEY